MEKWKPIDKYDGVYHISNMGNVKRVLGGQGTRSNYILKNHFEWTGYMYVKLRLNGKTVHEKIHRLVADAFIKKAEGKNVINHKNGIKHDNRVENLERCTSAENNLHAYRVLGKKKRFTLNGPNSKAILVYKEDNLKFEFPSAREASRILNIGFKSISNNLTGRSHSAGGYVFKYKVC